jgi:hypothetical protein
VKGRTLAIAMMLAAPAVAAGSSTVHAVGGAYQATASAEGVRVGVAAPRFLLVEQLVDAGAPVAQAAVDGLGGSSAFASVPYPGDVVVTLPGTLAAGSGHPVPPEARYPLYAGSDYPAAQEAKVSEPGLELVAHSESLSSRASGMVAAGAGDSVISSLRSQASADRDPAAGTVRSVAITAADGISLGGVLQIGHVVARAEVTRAPDGQPARRSEFHADGVSIGGRTVGLDEKGLVVPGSGAPLPDTGALSDLLRQAHVTVTVLAPTTDPDGIVSGGLRLTAEQQIPGGPPIVVSYTFGRAVAHASASGGLPLGVGSLLRGLPAAVDGGTSASRGGSAGDGLLAPAPRSPGAVGGSVPAPGGPPPVHTAPVAVATGGAGQPPQTDDSSYLVLVAAAVIGVGAAQLIRLLGVRSSWTS